jgi:hypothetical protein
MIPVHDEDIGGAVVRRRIDRGQLPPLMAGARLSREEVLSMPVANRRALVATERLWLLPKGGASYAADDMRATSHVVQVGKNLFDVIQGVKLNDQPLSKEAAEELATRPAS